jgi:hypothetical protein
MRLEERNLCVEQKAPKPLTPCLATSDRADASLRRAAQLAEPALSFVEGLKQSPPVDESIRPKGQSGGVREKKVESRED